MKRLIRPVRHHSFVIGPSSEANGTGFGAKSSFYDLPLNITRRSFRIEGRRGSLEGHSDWQNASVFF